MYRLSVSFEEVTAEKLKKRAEKKGSKTVAETIRELVELGLRVEEAMEKKSNNDDVNDLKALAKLSATWAMESKILLRFLVQTAPWQEDEKKMLCLQQSKDMAIAYIDSYLNKKIEAK